LLPPADIRRVSGKGSAAKGLRRPDDPLDRDAGSRNATSTGVEARCVVPKLMGTTLAAAKKRLTKADRRLGKVTLVRGRAR
jgi:hypothetical protein